MNITEPFVRRPVLAIAVSLIILVAGLQAADRLSVRQYPRSDSAAVVVNTAYIGADAELVRGFITTPLERAIAAADGIDYLESQSRQGLSTITARLELNYDPVKALAEISAKVNQVRGDLPPEAEVPVIDIQSADSQFASAYLSFTSDILAHNQITDYLARVVQPRLAALEGVQRAEILGGRVFALRAWLDPVRMAAFGVTAAELRNALAANNYLSALGQTKGPLVAVTLTADTEIQTLEGFRKLVVRRAGDRLVRLEDIARVELGGESYDTLVRFSGRTAVFMGIWPLPTANTLDVMERVRAAMAGLQNELPRGLEARIAYDATRYIDNAIREVVGTLTETLLIVTVVIFLSLGALRSALIPVLAIPLSLLGALFLMQVFGFTLNLLTLLAIVLSVGLVVDDAIVVVENVERRLRLGETPLQAALSGSRELVGPIIAMTITLAAVYAPIAFQGGLTGSLFREFALTLAGAVFVSGVVALTLSPMLAGRLLVADIEEHGLARHSARFFDRLREAYGRLLDRLLAVRPAVYVVWLGLSALTVPMYLLSPKELAPLEDQGVIFSIVNADPNATVEQTARFVDAVNAVYMGVEETEFTFQLATPGSGFAGMVAAPWDERERSIFDILPEVRAGVQSIPGIEAFAIVPPSLPGAGGTPVEFVVTSTDDIPQMLEQVGALAEDAARSGLFYFPPQLDVRMDRAQARLRIDRDKVAALGLDLRQVGADLGALLGGAYVNRFNLEGRSYKVIPQVERRARMTPEQVLDLYIRGPDGPLPVRAVARVEYETVPRSLNRFNQQNAVKLSGVPSRPLGEVLDWLEARARTQLPEGYAIDYTGESRQLRSEGGGFLRTFALALALIFLVLAAQFNSFRDPFIILAGSVPLAMFGALIFTFLKMPNPDLRSFTDGWTTTLNIYSQIGLVTLVGLVAKNGILIVEFAKQLQRRGLDKLAAAREAAVIRLRPVLMTAAATVCGHFPLVLVSGPGAEARNAIGLVIVGGMIVGTVFTLFVVPALYPLIAREHRETSA